MNEWSAADSLIDCLRTAEPSAALSAPQWQAVLDLAERHGLLSLLQSRIGSRPDLPEPARQRLREAYVTASMRGLQLYVEIETIVRALSQVGLQIILLKGACLAQECYGNVALRPMTDIDLLARRDELQRVADVFRSIGYSQQNERPVDEQCARGAHLEVMTRPGKYPVEIHWHIEGPDSPFRVDLEGLWQRKRPMQVGKESTNQFSPEDVALHLCLHAARHAWRDWADEFALKSICDIAAICRSAKSFDWPLFLQRVIESRAQRAVFLMLTLACDWLNAAIPAEVLRQLRPIDFDPAFLLAAKGQMLSAQPVEAIGVDAARVIGSEPLHKRVALAARRLFPPAAELRKQYSLTSCSPLMPLYYLVRWRDLIRRDLPALICAVRRKGAVRDQIDQASRGRALRGWLMTTR